MAGGAWRRGPRCALAPELLREPQAGDPSLTSDLTKICASRSRLDFVLYWSSFGPCHAVFSTLFLKRVLLCSCFPGPPKRARKVWWACSLSPGYCGFVLFLLCGWLLLRYPNGLEKPIWGPEARRSLLPLLFWYLFCCHFRSHSCSENIVADTQQDDLLAVIHRESSQTGFFPLMITYM